MINNLKFFFDKNTLTRIITGIFFVVPFVLCIIKGGYLFIAYFLLILSILLYELKKVKLKKNNLMIKLTLIALIILSFFHFIFLRIANDENIVLYLLFIIFSIWIFDSFSFIGGRLIGGKKLMPSVSPNKTYSGLLVGFLSILIFSLVISYFYNTNYKLFLLGTLIIGLVSFLGDGLESYFKRYLNIKDFSNFLPGHGGFLDRMDAFIFIFFVHFILIIFNFNLIILYV